MRLFHRHQILLAHAYARSGNPALCLLDLAPPRARLFDTDYDRLMGLVTPIANPSQIVPQSTGDLQFVELTGGPCSCLVQLAYAAESRPERLIAKAARKRARQEAKRQEVGQMMLGAT